MDQDTQPRPNRRKVRGSTAEVDFSTSKTKRWRLVEIVERAK